MWLALINIALSTLNSENKITFHYLQTIFFFLSNVGITTDSERREMIWLLYPFLATSFCCGLLPQPFPRTPKCNWKYSRLSFIFVGLIGQSFLFSWILRPLFFWLISIQISNQRPKLNSSRWVATFCKWKISKGE